MSAPTRTRSIPWPRILAEGVAIVLSILLAFGIQAWWENRQERAQEAAYLAALQDEVEENREIFDGRLTLAAGKFDLADHYLASVVFSARPVARDTLLSMIWELVPGAVQPAQDAALTDLLSSGGLGLLQSAQTRRGIGRYQRLMERVIEAQETFARDWSADLSPYLRQHGSLPDIFPPDQRSPGMAAGSFDVDQDAFVQNRDFANLLIQFRAANSRLEARLQQLLDEIDQLIALLDAG